MVKTNDQEVTVPQVLQPSNFASRDKVRKAAGRRARRGSTINRLDYAETFTMPARVPVKDRTPESTVILVRRPGTLEKP